MKIIGQEKLLTKLDSYTLATLPRTILFLGEVGCGKRTVARHVAEHLGLNFVELTDKVTHEDLTEYSHNVLNTLYLINLSNFTEKQQNQFLKFIEEPSSTVYVILTAPSEIGVLPTILNRCMKLHFEPYTLEQLKYFEWMVSNPSELLYKLCETPGQLMDSSSSNIEELYNFCNVILAKISQASYPNALKLETKINYAENYNKFDFNLFFKMMKYTAFQDFKKTGNNTSFEIYQLTNQYIQQLFNKTVAKENFVINYITNLWRSVHNEH